MVTTFRYEIATPSGNILTSIPLEPVSTAYSLHLFDSTITSTDQLAESETVIVFPNPSNGKFSINYELINPTEVELYVFDFTGKVTMVKEIPFDKSVIELDLTSYPNGVYFCQIVSDSGIIPVKLIKQ